MNESALLGIDQKNLGLTASSGHCCRTASFIALQHCALHSPKVMTTDVSVQFDFRFSQVNLSCKTVMAEKAEVSGPTELIATTSLAHIASSKRTPSLQVI